jgi:WD40 repeat protein/serine/threonine protein kinase
VGTQPDDPQDDIETTGNFHAIGMDGVLNGGEETRAIGETPRHAAAQQQPSQNTVGAHLPDSPGTVPDTAPQLSDWVGNAQKIAAASNVITPAKNSRFVLRSVLGRGGFGEVWETVQTSLWRLIAVKRPRLDLIQSPMQSPGAIRQQEIQFYQEAMTMAALDHPNIVPVYDLGVDGNGLPIVAMKKVSGRSWQDLIMEEFNAGSVQQFLERHVRIMIDCANAVAFAHSRGIIHRDIKPAQVIVGEFGETLLTDWGVAVVFDLEKAAQHNPLFLESGYAPDRHKAISPAGTWAFMAPEQTLRTSEQLGPWTDIYLIGGTLYYLLTGRPAHDGRTPEETMQFASNGYVAPPQVANGVRYIPPDLAYLAMRCMAPSPNQRPESIEAVIQDLQEWVSGSSQRREALEILRKLRLEFEANDNPEYEVLAEWEDSLARATALCPGEDEAYELGQILAERHASTAIKNEDLNLASAYARRLANPSQRGLVLERIEAVRSSRRMVHFQRVAAVTVSVSLFVMVLALYLLATKRANEAQNLQEEAKLESQRRIRQADIADERRQRAEREQYLASLQFALSAIGEEQYASAMQALLAGDPSLRDWEWEWLAARCHRELLILPVDKAGVGGLTYHPSGQWILTASPEGHIRLWSTRDGLTVAQVDMDSTTTARELKMSPDGKWAALSTESGQVFLIDVQPLTTGKSTSPQLLAIDAIPTGRLEFSPDSQLLLFSTTQNQLRLHDLMVAAKPARTMELPHPPALYRFTPSGRTIVVAGIAGPVSFWERDSLRKTHEISANPPADILSLAVSPDSSSIALGHQNGLVRILDSLTGAEISALPPGDSAVTALQFSPSGQRVVAAFRNRYAMLGEPATGRLLKTIESHRGEITDLAFSPRGGRLATSGKDGNLVLHDSENGNVIQILPGHLRPLNAALFAPSGLQLATASEDGTVRTWLTTPARATLPVRVHGGPVRWVGMAADGTYSISASDDGTLRRLHLPSGIETGHFITGGPPVAIGWNPNNSQLALATQSGPIRIIDANTMAVHQELPRGAAKDTAQLTSLAFGPGLTVVGGYTDGSLRTWSLETANLTGHIQITTGTIRSLDRAAGSGLFAAADSEGYTTLINADKLAGAQRNEDSSRSYRRIAVSPYGLHSVRFSPDGTQFLSTGMDGVARIHSTATGALLRQLKGHVDEVRGGVWHPSGTRIATVGKDATLRLWDSTDGREVLTIPGHSDTVHGVAFTPDGLTLATASHDRSLLIHRVEADSGSNEARTAANWEERLIVRRRESQTYHLTQAPQRIMPPGYERMMLFQAETTVTSQIELMRGMVELAGELVDCNEEGVSLAMQLIDSASDLFSRIPPQSRSMARQLALEVLLPAAVAADRSGRPTTAGLQLSLNAYQLAVQQWTLRRITAHDSAVILETTAHLLDQLGHSDDARAARRRALLCAMISVPRDRYLMDQPLGLRGPEFIEILERQIRTRNETLPPPPPDELVFGSNRTRTNWLPGWVTFNEWRDSDEAGQDRITAEIDRRLREYLDREAGLPIALTQPTQVGQTTASLSVDALLEKARRFSQIP